MNWPVYWSGFAIGMALEKWSVWFGYPDRTNASAWLWTVAAIGFVVWATYREKQGT